MTWHMIFGGLLIVGSVMRMLDILLFEERKGFFWIWVVALVIGAGMMITYREPHGAYEPASQEQKIEFQQDLEMLKEKWSLI